MKLIILPIEYFFDILRKFSFCTFESFAIISLSNEAFKVDLRKPIFAHHNSIARLSSDDNDNLYTRIADFAWKLINLSLA